jgi:hypothetical protein
MSSNLRLAFDLLFLAPDFCFPAKWQLVLCVPQPAAVGLSFIRCLSVVVLCKAPPCFLTALIVAQLFYSTRIPLRAHARPCPVEKR